MTEKDTARFLLPLPQRRALLAGLGLVAFHLCQVLSGTAEGLWLPAMGVGLALTAWVGYPMVILLAMDSVVAHIILRSDRSIALASLDGLLQAGEIGLAWWLFRELARGNRRLEDPRSATVFLLIVPGVVAATFAGAQAWFWRAAGVMDQEVGPLTGALWISRILGILTLTPFMLVAITPQLIRLRAIGPDGPSALPGGVHPDDWTSGELIESGGLCVGSAILSIVLVSLHVEHGVPGWTLWGLSLLLVVWGSLRQGLRGGSLVALAGGCGALTLATAKGLAPSDFSPLQGNILAQCSTALLVGASAGWIRANEARYRQVVGQIPVVLYSVRLPRGFTLPKRTGERGARPEPPARALVKQAEITLVSQAAQQVFQSEPDSLLGSYQDWVERVWPEDRELLLAALGQLCMQRQPVSCEYRLRVDSAAPRWVRDTMAPNYQPDGTFEGWEGVVEDISEQRTLAQSLRRTTAMFQALITHLPTGVFFVQGPIGQPLLVNARARQLLGQREDLAAGIIHLSKVYRLHKPDGSEYPAEDLPVARALRLGTASAANDIVVHRPDGRRIPLITWAAPVNMGGGAAPDAAVWVLEDLSALQQAEVARKESEARLRATIEAMAEGLLVQDERGRIIECNPAACAILGRTAEQLLEQPSLCPEAGCIREDGSPFPREEQPDRLVVRTGEPVRNVLMGIPFGKEGEDTRHIRWIYVNAMPLGLSSAGSKAGRVVTTFVDFTALRKAQEDLRRVHRLELVARIASGTLHDFNNMLTVMIGLADIAQNALPGDHLARQDLQRLVEVGEQAGHLAAQLLTFSRQQPRSPHPLDLNASVIHAIKILRSAIPANIQLVQQVPHEEERVMADEMQLKQVVMNLCLNARDAIRGQGTITVRTYRDNDLPLDGETDASQGASRWVHLAVEDNGSGMSEAVRARIFEPFFSTKERGTGLGLAVVRQIVDELGGRINVDSEPGKGTRIVISLPSLD